MTACVDLRDAQALYEEQADSAAQAARLAVLVRDSAHGNPDLPKAAALMGRLVHSVQEYLQEQADITTRGKGGKYKGWLRALPLDVAAVLAIRECIQRCSQYSDPAKFQDLAYAVGALWELEVRVRQAEVVNKPYMQKMHEQIKIRGTKDRWHIRRAYNFAIKQIMKGAIEYDLTRADIMHIGKFGVDACLAVGLIELVHGKVGTKMQVHYILGEEYLDFITDYTHEDVSGLMSRSETYMLCPPDEWSTLYDGGYLSNRRKAAAPLMELRQLRKSVRGEVSRAFTAEAMPMVFEAANYLQSHEFKIHPEVRKAILRVWDTGGGAMGVPLKNKPIKPEFPFTEEWSKETAPDNELEEFQRWKRSTARWYNEMKTWRGRNYEVGAFLKHTNRNDSIWFPVYFDKRGRWYYRGIPNPQGSDLAKAVLHFAEKKPLGPRGVFWLKVHMANSFGFDKERMQNRADFIDHNWNRIQAALDAPEEHLDVWGTDSPWCMFAAAWELREALRSGNPETYCTGIPIHMDATCSGLQHLSAVLKDPVGALYTNITEDGQMGPKQDIYSKVGCTALEVIKRDTESSDAVTSSIAKWVVQHGISRTLAKKPVMTYVYGATLRGTSDYVGDILEEELKQANARWPDDILSNKICFYIAQKLFQGIEATVPAAAAAMRWLRSVAAQIPNGQRIQWRTPTGFLVQHDYLDSTSKAVHMYSCGITKVIVQEDSTGTSSHRMQNAIAPNFVHSMDASHLTKVALTCKVRGLSFVGIHDSFGTHPNDVDELHSIIRQEFYGLYKDGTVLENFLWDSKAIGAIPNSGTLDLSKVLTSEFFFS